ncbi:MAG TPA: GNAT family N-acetyltransferase [Pyrinomonadaceae bacterium]|nr:GNAT family N-acetyltransferase [Pyrinomonadaceae bacterium]
MPDMLVNLLKLPPLEPELAALKNANIVVRRAQPYELTPIRSFVESNFSTSWADEILVGFANSPVTVFIATLDNEPVGFAAYECTRRDFFGPMGVVESRQRKGIGKGLLLACLQGLKELGYVYGIIGGVGPMEFYEQTVGAVVIPGSEPGIYTDFLK